MSELAKSLNRDWYTHLWFIKENAVPVDNVGILGVVVEIREWNDDDMMACSGGCSQQSMTRWWDHVHSQVRREALNLSLPAVSEAMQLVRNHQSHSLTARDPRAKSRALPSGYHCEAI